MILDSSRLRLVSFLRAEWGKFVTVAKRRKSNQKVAPLRKLD